MERRRRPPNEWSFATLYERHFDFVWRTLRHLGVPDQDLSDACQEVFIVIHRRLSTFEGRSRLTTWIFQICFNMARDRNRRAHVRREVLGDAMMEHLQSGILDPHAALERRDEEGVFERALATMDMDQRAAFVLFEIEDLTGPEVAEALGVPLGTAYSRLRLARAAFQTAIDAANKDEEQLLRLRGVS